MVKKSRKKTKEILSSLILEFIYESKKLLTSRSLTQYFLYEYYQAKKSAKKDREKFIKQQKRIHNTVGYLKRAGLVTFDDRKRAHLSNKGIFKVILNKIEPLKKKKKKAGLFYLVIFDIPERERRTRHLFRKVLYHLGAERIQKSVFIIHNQKAYQYIKELVKRVELSPHVKLLISSKIEK